MGLLLLPPKWLLLSVQKTISQRTLLDFQNIEIKSFANSILVSLQVFILLSYNNIAVTYEIIDDSRHLCFTT